MQELLIAGHGFQRVTDGVAKIEHRPIVLITLIFLDDARFNGAASGDDLDQQLAVQAR